MDPTAAEQMRDFAERLIVYEINGKKSSGPGAAFAVSQKLRPKLATLMGDVGFRALLSRALARAGAEVPSLHRLRVNAEGSLEGFAELEAHADPEEISRGRVALVAHLFGLLVAFIGEDLTLRLAREVWPKLSFNDWILAGDTDE